MIEVNIMKIGIGADHRGYKLKNKLVKYLQKKKIEFVDYGTFSEDNRDYNDYAYPVCKAVLDNEVDKGILICGTGIGMSIAANKMRGIMCAKVDNYSEAKLATEHNHANVIAFSAKKSCLEMKDIVDAFLKSTPNNDEKYLRRIDKIFDLEKQK